MGGGASGLGGRGAGLATGGCLRRCWAVPVVCERERGGKSEVEGGEGPGGDELGGACAGEETCGGPWLRVRTASKRVDKPTESAWRTPHAWRWVSGAVSSKPDCISDIVVDTVDMTADNRVAKWSRELVDGAARGEEGGLGVSTRRRLPSQESVSSDACRSRAVSVGVMIGG